MTKVFQIALREFLFTVATKGFILGMLVTPLLIGLVIVVMPRLWNDKPPKIDGQLGLVDPTGTLMNGLRDYLEPQAIAGRRGDLKRQIREQTPPELEPLGAASAAALEQALGEVPSIRVVPLGTDVDIEAEKAKLYEGTIEDGGPLALAVVRPNAVHKSAGDEAFGTYELFVREKLDDRIVDEIKDGLAHSIVSARVREAGLDHGWVEELTNVAGVKSTTVTAGGEQETNELLNILLPMGFMILLLMSVLTSGQYLMTTTIEEKSSRVVEVLLSAASPMQLMTGKIIGQMCVGFLIMLVYAGMGILGLVTFALLGLLDLWLFVYLIIFYLITYFVLGSLMAAIGAAVNEPREAQTFMMPIMHVVMIPWMLWMPILRDPNSAFATVASFLPPINTFVMLLRLTSTTPPPFWQVWISIAIGVASVWAALWFAAKVFRVGLLLHGKPPNFATLVRWVRMS